MNKFFSVIAVLFLLTGCYKQSTLNPNAMTYQEAQSILSVDRGVVIAVEQAEVTIEGSDDVAAVGGLIGGLAGSQVGQGKGAYVGAGLGALGAGILGKALTEKTELAFVYTVEKKDGGIMMVSQTGNMLAIGSPVLVRHFQGGRKTLALDQSQGKVFTRAKETEYAGDAARKAAEAKKLAIIQAKRAKREQAEYDLMMESKKLDLESKKLSVKSKSLDVDQKGKRVAREDEYIDQELSREQAKTKVVDELGDTIDSVGKTIEKDGISLF